MTDAAHTAAATVEKGSGNAPFVLEQLRGAIKGVSLPDGTEIQLQAGHAELYRVAFWF